LHPTAKSNFRHFLETYAVGHRIVEIGSQDVNGNLRDLAPADCEYVGVDFVSGKGVDVVIDDPYFLPFESESADVVLSSSCLEHCEMFWLAFLEQMRILKPDGLLYLNAPSNGAFHQYPVDCWRFYPDSGKALVTWAKRNGMNPALLESYTSRQVKDQWNDYVAIFVKDESNAHKYQHRILDRKRDIYNGVITGREGYINYSELPQDAVVAKLVRPWRWTR